MKKLIIIFIFIFNFQSFTWADDIRDFEIEGISVEDSLLDFFSEEKIINSEKTIYPGSNNFYSMHIVVDSKKALGDKCSLCWKIRTNQCKRSFCGLISKNV